MKQNVALFEIILLVGATIAFAYIVNDNNSINYNSLENPESESFFVAKARALFISTFGGNLVSAQELSTCLVNLQGTKCQEYPSSLCSPPNGPCASTCIPARAQDVSECKSGTCIDPVEGTCAPNSPKAVCESSGGNFDNRTASEIPACKPGCCLMRTQALYRTEQACNVLRDREGVSIEFRPVPNELACLSFANLKDEGACVLNEVEPNNYGCKFGTREQCTALGGAFHKNLLCSNPQLNTICTRQIKTACVEGKDEVYWFDSCGNRENIYQANKGASWKEGILLPKSESCELVYGSNGKISSSSQAGCGNCNYLGGSVCGAPRAGQDTGASIGNYVCRDLSCIDEWEDRRKSGESWCMYDGQIGPQGQGNDKRSVDVPGSEHYRRSCVNGEVRTEQCGNARSSICVESRNEEVKFSAAACRINQWQQCLKISAEYAEKAKDGKADQSILDKCNEITDCYIKEVEIGSKFKFGLCVPKYPPGFDLRAEAGGEVGEGVCAFGTQTCTYVKVNGGLFSSNKEFNKECKTSAFADSMNNLCMSLGDCGVQVNVAGEVSDSGANIISSRGTPPDVSSSYINDLRGLAQRIKGQHADPLSEEEIAALYGFDINDPNYQPSKFGDTLGTFGIGATGILATYIYLTGSIPGFLTGASATAATSNFALYGAVGPEAAAAATAPGITAFGGAIMGAAAGAAIGYLAAQAFGIQGDAATELVIIGALTGVIAGVYFLSGVNSVATFAATVVPFIAVVILVVVAFALIFSFLGAGKKTETKIEFQCLPWQPPLGGAKCGECGKDGRECSKYMCQSLGQSCGLVNEGTNQEACINTGANDVLAPIISPNPSVLLPGYTYTQSQQGLELRGPGDGRVPYFTQIRIGIKTDERAQCKVSNVHTANYDAMTTYFSSFKGYSSNLFIQNHTATFSILSNEAVLNEQEIDDDFKDGEKFNPGIFAPDASGNVNLYVRCTDFGGRKNEGEYVISYSVSAVPDRTPPIISSFDPPSPGFAKIDATEKSVRFYTNEPAECRWAEDSNTVYDAMTTSATCATGLAGSTLLGSPCNATLPLAFTGDDKTFYFRCSDMPWANDTNLRNKNSESIPYTIKRTLTPLLIDSITPNGQNIFTNGLPLLVNLSATTRGGAEGSRWCDYKWGTTSVQFFETGTDVHLQRNIMIASAGNYTIPVRCYDTAGNEAFGNSTFSVDIDNLGPQVTRVYNLNGLNVITNEKAKCAYSLSSCSFNFVNGTLMSGNELVHTSSFNNGLTHYVICRDVFDNVGACTQVGAGQL